MRFKVKAITISIIDRHTHMKKLRKLCSQNGLKNINSLLIISMNQRSLSQKQKLYYQPLFQMKNLIPLIRFFRLHKKNILVIMKLSRKNLNNLMTRL